ncbi:hypothetical protein BZG36_02526 [Bifiguratus adelaidae]|uniref:Uncharacterized protein n=1 Tax=Bifiguratus adelaidae TaxID=1938954 RepID=A0A261Y2M5_9FUNG|nr:hypothetical protein BZG36_02526 [Bifiguratus adelaidae]
MIDYIAPFLTFAAWVLQLFAFVGDLANRPFIDGIYYVKLDITGNVPSFIGVLENDVGIPDFVTFGLFGFCQGYYSSGIYYCSPPQLGYKFQPQGTVEQVFANLTPGLFTGFITSVQAGVFIPALILTFITFCIGLFGFRYRGANIGASVVCFFAFCLTLATFVIEIVAYTTVGGSLTLITLFTR